MWQKNQLGTHMAFITVLVAALVIVAASSPTVASATNSRKQNDKPLLFTYTGATRPEMWGSLSPKFKLCSNGKSQSPIDIVTEKAMVNKNLKPLIRNYHPSSNITLVDYKYTVGVEYPEHVGEIFVDGKPYALKQMHWHSPSEHRINGKRYAAEMHMVHVSEDGAVAVVGTLFKLGRPDPVLRMIHNKLNKLAYDVTKNREAAPMAINEAFPPKELRSTSHKYYKYIGSFSVPPCTENIPYLILAKARSISPEQVGAIKATLDARCKNNARPCQPINARQVEVYQE